MAYLKATLVGIATGLFAGVFRIALQIGWSFARIIASGGGDEMDLFSPASILLAVGVGFVVGFAVMMWRERRLRPR